MRAGRDKCIDSALLAETVALMTGSLPAQTRPRHFIYTYASFFCAALLDQAFNLDFNSSLGYVSYLLFRRVSVVTKTGRDPQGPSPLPSEYENTTTILIGIRGVRISGQTLSTVSFCAEMADLIGRRVVKEFLDKRKVRYDGLLRTMILPLL